MGMCFSLEFEDESTPFQGTVELNPTFEDLHEGKPGCVIPKPELRAITVGQLNKLTKHVKRRCEPEEWADSRDPSNKFTPETFNLYAMDVYVIRPATEARECAYVELVAICAQPPKWFCSHWWGEPVLDFVACVVTHALDHGYSLEGSKNDPTAGYWVCAYANNQWDLTSVNAPTLKETSFYKALKLAEGAVSILDSGGMCFARVWCSYECSVVLTQIEGLKYEVYTANEHDSKNYAGESRPRSAVGIIDGLGMRDEHNDEDAEDKALREVHFPVGLAKQAFQLTLETAQASVEADRVKILNTIAEQADLAATPPETHKRYDALNAILRGRFAIVALRGLLEAGQPIEQAAKLLKGCGRRKLELGFKGVDAFDAHAMQLIAQNLPAAELEELDMARGGLEARHMPALAQVLEVSKMKALNLEYNNIQVPGAKALGEALAMNKSLTSLNLYYNSVGDAGAEVLSEALKTNSTLQTLNLEDNNIQADGAKALGEALSTNKSLTSLNLRSNGLNEEAKAQLHKAVREGLTVHI